MRYNTLGNTGLFVSELCLGTMTYGGKGFWATMGDVGEAAVVEQFETAFAKGVNFIDTANVYHEGLSEELVGRALQKTSKKRHEVVLATKVLGRMGPGPNEAGLSRAHIFHQIDESLRRLQTDYVDLYQIHGFDPMTPIEETLDALNDVVRSGKARYIGMSNQPAWRTQKALSHSAHRGLARFQSAQMYYSLVCRDLEDEFLPMCREAKLGVLVWSPLSGGLLSGKFAKETSPEGTRRATFDFPPTDTAFAWPVVDVLKDIASARECSAARVALAWTRMRDGVTSVIIGARTQAQLEDNLACVDLTLTDDEVKRLDAVSARFARYPGWMVERQSRHTDPNQG